MKLFVTKGFIIQRFLPLEKIEELVIMFEIIKGDIKKVKKEMKEAKTVSAANRRAILKKCKGKIERASNEEMLLILEADKMETFFHVTATVPAYFGDFLLNYQLVNEFAKKLKSHIIGMDIVKVGYHRELHIAYQKPLGGGKGRLELMELPKDIFGKLKSIPTVECTYTHYVHA